MQSLVLPAQEKLGMAMDTGACAPFLHCLAVLPSSIGVGSYLHTQFEDDSAVMHELLFPLVGLCAFLYTQRARGHWKLIRVLVFLTRHVVLCELVVAAWQRSRAPLKFKS